VDTVRIRCRHGVRRGWILPLGNASAPDVSWIAMWMVVAFIAGIILGASGFLIFALRNLIWPGWKFERRDRVPEC
jgi:hypothetical protein